jgi:putative molybdopterin biosynthesis protein
MIEDVHTVDEERIEIDKGVVPWQHVRRVGEDFVSSEMIVPARKRISAYEQGALLAGAIHTVQVVERPRVHIIPTGDELYSHNDLADALPGEGQAIEFNSVMLSGLIHQAGGVAGVGAIVPDDFDRINNAIDHALDRGVHLVIVIAGSSAGSKDYTAEAIRSIGEVLVHGVAMMPGKPTILGVARNRPVMGIPGYPVSAVLSFELFGWAVLAAMQGLSRPERQTLPARAARKIPSKLGREEFFRVKLGRVGQEVVAAPLPRGAGSITTLTRADGIIRIPPLSQGVDQASRVDVELLKDFADIERTLMIIGSHDLTLDVLADELGKYGVHLASSHVGSLGGLSALKHGTAHVAPCHLLDEASGRYNWPYISRYLPDVPVKLFHGVTREQGFIVPKGNPKEILTFQDLAREDVTFVNRQAGAGTRVLLDYHLGKLGIDPGSIQGYRMEEYTHTSVAVAVLSGVADAGMGVLAAAKALDLDFVPVATEQYELVIPEQFLAEDKVTILLNTIRSDTFKERVLSLGGYGVERSGEEVPQPD